MKRTNKSLQQYRRKYLKLNFGLLLITLSLAVSQDVFAVPIYFQRLIMKRTNQSDQVIDLIGEAHVTHPSTAKRGSKWKKRWLPESSFHLANPSEGTLLAILKKMTQPDFHQESIDFIWELGGPDSFHDDSIDPTSNNIKFLNTSGKVLFEALKSQELPYKNFIFGDTFRDRIPELANTTLLIHLQTNPAATCNLIRLRRGQSTESDAEILQSLNSILANEFSSILLHTWKVGIISILTDLTRLISRVDSFQTSDRYTFLNYYFHQFYHSLKTQVLDTVDFALFNSPTIQLKDFFSQLPHSWSFEEAFHDLFIVHLEDLELVTKLLTSNADHVVVYAGKAHLQNISESLLKYRIATELLKFSSNASLENYQAPLAPNVYAYLQEPLDLAKKRRKISIDTQEGFFEALFRSNSEQELISFIKSGFKRHIDVLNTVSIKDKNRTLLHLAALNKWPNAFEFLLARGANQKIRDQLGKTPMDYAKDSGLLDRLQHQVGRTPLEEMSFESNYLN